MKKIRLDIDRLDVQSFITAAPSTARGTVPGAGGDVVGPATVSQPPQCWVESGYCLGTRYDDICDTSFCISSECELESGPPCVIFTGADCNIDTLAPNC